MALLPKRAVTIPRASASTANARSTSIAAPNDELDAFVKGVVQVFLTSSENDWDQPWSRRYPEQSTGSGFVVDVAAALRARPHAGGSPGPAPRFPASPEEELLSRRVIVTNAHCVQFASTLQVKSLRHNDKFEAVVLAVCHDVDIALLTVTDDSFWPGSVALELSEKPVHMQQGVEVVGFPVGGDTVSITSGVVSRIDWSFYAHSEDSNLCVTVDAAINPGNSGGPARSSADGAVVGVAFQSLDEADNVGYVVPHVVLRRVLEDFVARAALARAAAPPALAAAEPAGARPRSASAHAARAGTPSDAPPRAAAAFAGLAMPRAARDAAVRLSGFARLPVAYQCAENKNLRAAVGLPNGHSGVVVRDVEPLSCLHGRVLKDDVITSIGGIKIGNDGKVTVAPYPPMDLRVVVSMKLVGEPLSLTVCRRGVPMTVDFVAEYPPNLAPPTWFGRTSYVMCAGLVFQPLCGPQFREKDRTYFTTLVRARFDATGRKHTDARQQIVTLAGMVPHRATLGYDVTDYELEPLLFVNDVRVDGLADVARALESAGEWIQLHFTSELILVLPTADARAATAEVQEEFEIKHAMSADMRGGDVVK